MLYRQELYTKATGGLHVYISLDKSAVVCSVFLSDVAPCQCDLAKDLVPAEPALRKSRLFTRRWTL